MNKLAWLLLALLALAACSSKDKPPPPPEEFFTSRLSEQGEFQFAFGLAWDAPERDFSPLRGQATRPADERPKGPRLEIDASPEWKIRMEELAVDKLQKRLRRVPECRAGHQINDIIWERNRIRLMGQCA